MKIRPWVPAVLALGLILMSMPGWAQTLRIIPVPPGVKPQWRAVTGAPNVSFAPNIPTDVFRYRGRHYLKWDGAWFESRRLEGPWEMSPRPPQALGRIPPAYFKTARRQPQAGPSGGAQPPGAFQPPGAPSGTDKRDPFSVPGVAPPPGWIPPADRGLAEPIPPFEVTPEPGQGLAPTKQIPKAM